MQHRVYQYEILYSQHVPQVANPLPTTFAMPPITLRINPSPEDEEWSFTAAIPTSRPRPGVIMGKHISFSPDHLKLETIQFPSNRILHSDDASKFVLCSFESLRFPEKPASVAREYMLRFFQSGLFLNGVQYRFYGHSNSQLVSTHTSSLILRKCAEFH